MKLIDFLIIVGIITIAFFGYQKYFKEQKIIDNNIILEKEESKKEESKKAIKENNFKETEDKNLNDNDVITPEEDNKRQGFYENKKYYYEIYFPKSWPLKVRSEENVSIGSIIPKDGYGAITIEINKNGGTEIEEVKKEAEKYSSFIRISEEDIILSGIKGTKLILDNKVNNIKNIYIILEKDKIFYALKYTEESTDFILQVKEILSSFKFTK